jgi:hypothetical protein
VLRFKLACILAVLLSSCLALSPDANAQSLSSLNVVALSGKQRMLSQRALKAYAQLALNVLPEKATVILATSLSELRSGNVLLRGVAKDSTLTVIDAQAALIEKLAAVTAIAPSAGSMQQAVTASEDLLNNAEVMTQGFIKAGAEAPAALVNLAARQRMLSQRAASAYLAYQTPARSAELKARALKALGDFKIAITAFEDAKTEFPKIADRIELARIQMIFFDNALGSLDQPTKEQFTTIATTSERVLSEMDLMTADIVKQLSARSSGPSPAAGAKKQ